MADAEPAPAPALAPAAEPPKEPEPAPAVDAPVAPIGPAPEVEPAAKTATEPEREKAPEEKDANAETQKAEAVAAPPAPIADPPKPVTTPALPVAEPDPSIKPVARKFTTPAGQELTVLVAPVSPPKKDDVKPASTESAASTMDDGKPAPDDPTTMKDVTPPKAPDSKVPEPPTPAAPIVEETKSVETNPVKPGVMEEKKTVSTPPPAPVPEPAPSTSSAVTTTDKTSDPAVGAITTTTEKTMTPSIKAATIHEIPVREPTTDINHDDLRKSKSVNEQLGLPHAPTANALERPIGLWAELCAKSETTLIISEHVHSWSGDDYDVSDAASNKLFHIDGKFWSLSQRKHFKDMSGKVLFEIRKRHLRWPRVWYIQKDDKRLAWVKGRIGIGHRHSRIHFTNTAGDGKNVELHLRGHYFTGRGARLYLGPDVPTSLRALSSASTSAPTDSSTPLAPAEAPQDVMIAEIEPQDVLGFKARLAGKDTYKMTVAKNFDLALACIICVAVDERRTDNSQRSRNLNGVLHGRFPSG